MHIVMFTSKINGLLSIKVFSPTCKIHGALIDAHCHVHLQNKRVIIDAHIHSHLQNTRALIDAHCHVHLQNKRVIIDALTKLQE